MILVVFGAAFGTVWAIQKTSESTTDTVAISTQDTPSIHTTTQASPSGGSQELLNHDVYLSFSSDPESFPAGTLVTESASVPDVLVCGSGSTACDPDELLIYFVDPLNTTNSMEGVSVMRSTDAGKNWSEREPISIAGKTNKGPAVDPSVIQLADGTLRMYYFGPDKPFNGPGSSGNISETKNAVYSATSTDGTHFTQDDGVRFSALKLTDPEVVERNGLWLMYYSTGTQSGVASSSDGLTFVDEGVIETQTGGVPGAIVLEDGSVRVYGCSRDGILVSESADGLEPFSSVGSLFETKQQGTCDPAVDVMGDEYVLVYKKMDGVPPTPTPTSVPSR